MNAEWVRTTTSGTATGNAPDASLFNDPSQYDSVLHSGGPDKGTYTIWKFPTPVNITNFNAWYNGTPGGGYYVDFSTDGTSWSTRYGPFGVPSSGPGTSVGLPEDGVFFTGALYGRFYPASPSGDWALDESNFYASGVLIGPPGDFVAPTIQSITCDNSLFVIQWNETGSPPVTGNSAITLTSDKAPVTLSMYVTTGTTTTAVTSRNVYSDETLFASYAPGNYADSATSPNHVAAFVNYPVTNLSTFARPIKPLQRWTTAGCQAIALYPYGGPYDASTIEIMEGIQNVDLGFTVTLAELYGGDLPYILFSAEVKREYELRAQGGIVSLRLAQLLYGGLLAIDGRGTQNEKTLWAGTGQGRAGYFRMVIQSDNGDGVSTIVFPKVKASGSFAWNMGSDSANLTQFSAKPHMDKTYITQNGVVGAVFEWFFGLGMNNTSPVS